MLRAFVLGLALALAACGGSGGSGGDAPGNGDAAMVPKDGGTDADTTPPMVGAACGTGVTCKPAEACCMGATLACKTANLCPVPSFSCDGPEDCPGGKCCFGNQGQGGSSCTANCATPACHADTDCPASASKCCPKMFTPPGYKVCAAAC